MSEAFRSLQRGAAPDCLACDASAAGNSQYLDAEAGGSKSQSPTPESSLISKRNKLDVPQMRLSRVRRRSSLRSSPASKELFQLAV